MAKLSGNTQVLCLHGDVLVFNDNIQLFYIPTYSNSDRTALSLRWWNVAKRFYTSHIGMNWNYRKMFQNTFIIHMH